MQTGVKQGKTKIKSIKNIICICHQIHVLINNIIIQ